MTVAETMRKKLEAAFAPVALEVIDESEKHRGHGGFDGGLTAVFHKNGVRDHLGADKAPLKVGVDRPRGLGRFGAAAHRPVHKAQLPGSAKATRGLELRARQRFSGAISVLPFHSPNSRIPQRRHVRPQ